MLAQFMILPILASQVARITGMSHWCLDSGVSLVRVLDKKTGAKKKATLGFSKSEQDSKQLYLGIFALP
jgi:hypothetical protein